MIYVFRLIIDVYSLMFEILVPYHCNSTTKIVKNRTLTFIGLLFFVLSGLASAQESYAGHEFNEANLLFQNETPISMKWSYSDKDMRKQTNDSTFLDCVLSYQQEDGTWDSLEVQVRARGNWRKENCFLTPVKVRIKKEQREGTLFEGNKELKMVLPCRNNDQGQDYVLKEYMAYKIYEPVSPFHFKTRRVALEFTDDRGKKAKSYQLEAFFIEDTKEVADRCNAKRLRRSVHPQQQDDYTSAQSDFFQFMIANTDFSLAYQHNAKLLFVEGMRTIPVPYDFDMSGFVNTNYAVVSQIQGEQLPIDRVTDRLFRGYKRPPGVFEQVRDHYLSQKDAIMAKAEALQPEFRDPKQYEEARDFLLEYFAILQDKAKFKNKIVDKAIVGAE